MGYVEQNLLPGERVIARAIPHWGVFVGPVVTLLTGLTLGLCLSLPALAAVGATETADEASVMAAGALFSGLFCFAPFGLVGVLSLTGVALSYFSTEFAVTDRRGIAKTGFIQRRSLEVMLNKVESIGVHQGLVGRLLDFGTIVVSGSGGTRQGFPNIARPLVLRRAINNILASKAPQDSG